MGLAVMVNTVPLTSVLADREMAVVLEVAKRLCPMARWAGRLPSSS